MELTFIARGVRLLAPGIFLLCSSVPALAEVPKLTLPQVIEYSLQNNGDLKAFREEKGIRDAAKLKAGVFANPTFELDGSTGAIAGNGNENSVSVGISQEFITASKRKKRVAVIESELEMFKWQLADRERTLRQDIKTIYYDVVLSEQKRLLSERYALLNKQLFDVTKSRLEAGDIPELELNLVQVELARGEGSKAEIDNLLNQGKLRLATVMGLSRKESLFLIGEFQKAEKATKSLEVLKSLALENRPDIKVLNAEKTRGEADISLAKAEAIPNVTAGLNFKRDSTVTEIGSLKGRDTGYSVGLKLSIPIPLFDRNQSGVQEAVTRRTLTDYRLASATRLIEREVESAFLSLVNTKKTLDLYRTKVIPQLEENLKLTKEAYRLGEVGILAVIQEHKKFYEVNEGYLTALYNHQLALIKLETAVAADISGEDK